MPSLSKSKADTSFWLELLRYLSVGVYGTLIDYVVEVWLTSLFHGWVSANEANAIAAFFIMFLIGFLGFLIATPATWSLNAVWAFRNVEDEKGAKSLKGAVLFTFYAFLGLVGASIIGFLGYMTCREWSGLHVNILKVDFNTLFRSDIVTFWAYTVVFVLKTAFSTIFNYLIRKFVLYKAPKKEALPQ